MAEFLKIVNFKSEGDEPYEFEYSDAKSTIFNVKQFINDEESLDLEEEDLKLINIYWLCVALQDDVLVKDLLEQKAELYVSLPQFAEITATGNTFILLNWILVGVLWAPTFVCFQVKLLSSPRQKTFLDERPKGLCHWILDPLKNSGFLTAESLL